jgi:MYXO-CTERM domain-containing protein
MRNHLRSLLTAALLLAPAAAWAQPQLVAIDVTYEASTTTTHDAHYDVKPAADQPANWKSPIDYTAGMVYIHQEVMTKPSMLETQIDVCFDGDRAGYGCLNTNLYTTTGVHETVAKLSDMWQFNKVAWTQKRSLYQLVVKDKNNVNGGNPKSAFMPTKMRVVFTIVPPGGTYVPPTGAAQADGGSMPVVVDAGAPEGDASPPAEDTEVNEPPVTADAAAPPKAKPDAGAPRQDPPGTDPPSDDNGGDQVTPPRKPASSGCAVGGAGGGSWLVALLVLAAVRRRRTRRRA